MKLSDIKRPEYSSKVFGAVMIALGIYLILFTDNLNAALGAFFIGIFTMVVLHITTVDRSTAEASLESSVLPLNALLDDLELEGKGVFVPPQEHLSVSRTYIPAGEFNGLPDIYDEMTIISGGAGRTGISLEPLGKPLLDEAKDRMEYDFSGEGIEGARECMGILSQGLGLAKSHSLRREDGAVKLRITYGEYGDYCSRLREESSELCSRTGCPLCSAYLTAASEGTDRPLRIIDFEKEDEHVKYTLEEV